MEGQLQPIADEPTKEAVAAMRADARLPFECKVCKTRLGPQAIFRVSSAHGTGIPRKCPARPPKSGHISHMQQVYCSACCDNQVRIKELSRTPGTAPNAKNGPAVHVPPHLLGESAALKQLREEKKRAEAERDAPPVWERIDANLFKASGGMRIQRIDDKRWRVIAGKIDIVVKGLPEAFNTAAELKRSL